jgi:hypothetical protein
MGAPQCTREMASTRRPSRAAPAASNAWRAADGGCIFADARNAVTSVAVILHQASMHQNITPPQVIRSSRASSRVNTGFTTIALRSSSPARSLRLLTRIRLINQCRRRRKRCPQTGKRCFTNSRHTAICRAVRWPRRRHERHDVFMIPVASLWSGDIAAGLVVPSSPAPSLEAYSHGLKMHFFGIKKARREPG